MNEKELCNNRAEDYYNRLMNLFDNAFSETGNDRILRTDIFEEEENFKYVVDIPGIKKEDVSLSLDHNYLIIEVKRETPFKEESLIRGEKVYGTYTRSFYVGNQTVREDISAEVKDGVLTIVIAKPKKASEDEKRIEIR